MWWGLEAPRKGSEFLLQAQHSRNGAKKRGSWEEVGGGGEGKRDQTRLQHRVDPINTTLCA